MQEPSTKKRLLVATDNFLPRWDGISRFLSELLPELKEHFAIHIIAPKFPGQSQNDTTQNTIASTLFAGMHIDTVRPSRLRFGDYTPAIFAPKSIEQEVKQSDIVFIQAIGPIGSTALTMSKRHKKKAVAFIHSLEWELVMNSLSRRNVFRSLSYLLTKLFAIILYNRCDLLLVPTQEVEEIMTWQGITTPKRVIPLGVRTDEFRPADDKAQAKRNLGINPGDVVIGYCGRIGREKDLTTLYRAFRIVERGNHRAMLLVVGSGVEDHKSIELPPGRVLETGSQNNVVPYLQAMDIYVLPSLTETSSLSTMEAMSCGCAVLSTPVGYPARYIRDRYNGMFFPKRNHLVLSIRLRKLLNDRTLRERLGRNARETIVRDHNWLRTPAKIRDALLQV